LSGAEEDGRQGLAGEGVAWTRGRLNYCTCGPLNHKNNKLRAALYRRTSSTCLTCALYIYTYMHTHTCAGARPYATLSAVIFIRTRSGQRQHGMSTPVQHDACACRAAVDPLQAIARYRRSRRNVPSSRAARLSPLREI